MKNEIPKMKVLFLTYGGAHYKIFDMLNKNFDVTFFMNEKFREAFSKHLFHLGKLNIKFISFKIKFFLDAVKDSGKSDIILSNCPFSGAVSFFTSPFSGAVGSLAGILSGKKRVYIMCSDYYECFRISQNLSRLQKIAYGWLVRLMLRIACRGLLVIVLSRHLEKVAKRQGATKIKIVPIYGIDMNIFKPTSKRLNFGTNKKIILTTARLCPEKGLRYALEAVSKIEGVLMVIVGMGSTKEVEEIITGLKIEDRVKLVGEVDPVSIADYYNSCDVFIMPSLTEGLGFSSGEAMACKKPVIASNVGGVPDLVIDGKTGILVPPADPDALCEAIKRVLASKTLAKRLGENGYEHVKNNFEEKVVTEKFVSVIHEYYKRG